VQAFFSPLPKHVLTLFPTVVIVGWLSAVVCAPSNLHGFAFYFFPISYGTCCYFVGVGVNCVELFKFM